MTNRESEHLYQNVLLWIIVKKKDNTGFEAIVLLLFYTLTSRCLEEMIR